MDNRTARRWAFTRFGGPLAEQSDTLTAPTGHEVTVRVQYCGICHSDLHFQAGGFELGNGVRSSLERTGVKPPITMGHEIAGIVAECGPDVRGVSPGEPVVVYPWLGCGECAVCLAGDDHVCPKAMRNLGLQLPGGYADLVRVPHERYLVPTGTLAPARAATFACAGITAMSAVRRLGPLDATHTIAVVGAGGVGMTGVALLKALTPARIVVIDPDPAKRETALGFGAASAFDPAPADAAKTINKACGFDIAAAIDFVGSEASSALAVNVVRRTGQVVIVGLFGGEFKMALPLFALRSLQLTGSYVGSLNDLRELVALAQRVALPATPITLRPLAEVNEALADLAAGRVVGRTVLRIAG